MRRARAAYEAALAEAETAADADGDGDDGDDGPGGSPGSDETGTSGRTGTGNTGKGTGPRANTTDPQSRLLKTRNGWIQGYNCQTAVSDDAFIISARATQDPTDMAQFVPTVHDITATAARLTERTGRDDLTIGVMLGDAGYDSDANLTATGPDRLIADAKAHTIDQRATANPATGDPADDASAREQMNHRLRTPKGTPSTSGVPRSSNHPTAGSKTAADSAASPAADSPPSKPNYPWPARSPTSSNSAPTTSPPTDSRPDNPRPRGDPAAPGIPNVQQPQTAPPPTPANPKRWWVLPSGDEIRVRDGVWGCAGGGRVGGAG